ncbi:hypothetical protein GCK72_020341 [Caenorhabditis remanei]|uniref:Serpentine Receptor, class H n=1 Tax=Caenorhabditis remanei TaxID=31234 RepID=A0A6A5GG98_CAERE|nr:hypothetical protein GCK72_020341 [Caenorhabditis remanei]KAF1753784.1 hypothetical protein GCK72_020341 [Caenorhabditis remanei]
MIIMKTPHEMGKMKFSMLLMHMTFVTYDVWAILELPIIVFPICGGYSIGVLSSIGMPLWIKVHLLKFPLSVFGPAVTMFFENRYNYLVRLDCDTQSRRFKRAVHYFINYFIALNAFVPAFLNMPDQSVARQIALKKLPCLSLKIVNHPTFFMVGNEYLNFFYIGLFAIFSWTQTFFFFAKTVNFIFGIKSQSQRTTQLQREFFRAVCIQVALPFVVIMTPACYILSTIYTNNYDMAYTNFSVIMISSHGLFFAITMLLIHKPYRTETLKVLGIKRFYKSNKLAVVRMSPRATHNGLFSE